MDHNRIPPTVRKTYGTDDLAKVASFAGGFINFGYWQGIDLAAPTTEDRVRSQEQLYRRALREFPSRANGCGWRRWAAGAGWARRWHCGSSASRG